MIGVWPQKLCFSDTGARSWSTLPCLHSILSITKEGAKSSYNITLEHSNYALCPTHTFYMSSINCKSNDLTLFLTMYNQVQHAYEFFGPEISA